MDRIPDDDPMKKEEPLAGLDPAELLRQGAAEDTFVEGDAASFQPPPMEEIAAAFPQFEILGLIGKGGMGAVYKVRQRDLDRIVALKILPPAIGRSPEFSERFTREARALAKLNHPGIVTLHEFGQQAGLHFILMEFVDGVNLAQLMKTGRISPREALAIVPQICDALQYAHDQGVVHRDIKPENLLLDRKGRVKVADFGIAKVVAAACDPHASGETPAADQQTLVGKIIGTPQYMAPEQIEHPSEVDHRADIYALGVVFYQMLTGELPGKDLQAPSKKVHIDVRLDEIVLRAMEKRPEMRYQTAHELRTVVDGFPAPVHSRPPSLPLPAPKRGMMRRWWWVFLVMIPLGPVIGLATGAGWASLVPKKYETAATFEILPQNADGMTPGWVGKEFEKLTSRHLLADVADQLDLPARWQVNRDDAIGILKGIISVENLRGTDLMTVRVRHTKNEQAADIVNAVVSSYQRSFGRTVIVHDGPLRTTSPVSPSVANVRLLLVVGALGGLLLFPLMAVLLILILNRMFPEKNPADVAGDPELASAQKEAATRDVTVPDHRKSPFRSKKFMWILAVCLVTGVLWMTLGKSGRYYPVSSASSAFKTPVMGRIELKYTHADSMGGTSASYDVKMWGDTQWKPSSGMAITLKDGQSLRFKSRVNAMNPDSPMAMVTTSSDNSNWETKVLLIDGKDELQELVFSNGLRVEIQWSPVDPSGGNSEPPDPIQQDVMRQASKWADKMHPVEVDDTALSRSPELVFVGLQYPSKERWHPDGSPVTDPRELAWIREIGPIYAGDMSKGGTIRGMEFWFAHPLLERWHITEIEFLDESGEVVTRLGGVDGKPAETDGKEGRLHWSLMATPVDTSKPLNVRLNYTIGPLERVQEHIVKPHASGSTFNDGNTVIASVGQTAGDRAFLALAVDEATQSKHRYGVEAVTKDGKIIHHGSWRGGSGPDRPNIITYEFGVPISEVAKFRIGTRPLRSAVWKNVATSAFHETGTPTELVAAARAEAWLAGIDAGNYADSWKAASMLFQKTVAEAAWNEALTKFRKPLGEMKSRKFRIAQSADSPPVTPTEKFVIQFDTSFEEKAIAVETVTFVLEEDGIWRASGYYIR